MDSVPQVMESRSGRGKAEGLIQWHSLGGLFVVQIIASGWLCGQRF